MLREAAAERGVRDLEADVACGNRRTLALLRHHGFVVLGRDGAQTMRVSISTSERTPRWPESRERRPRILVEPKLRWSAGEAAREAGFEERCCPGPARGGPHPCPLLEGGDCPLVTGADVVVVRTGGRTHPHRRGAPPPLTAPGWGESG